MCVASEANRIHDMYEIVERKIKEQAYSYCFQMTEIDSCAF